MTVKSKDTGMFILITFNLLINSTHIWIQIYIFYTALMFSEQCLFYRFQSFHQRVVGFSTDPYHHESRSGKPGRLLWRHYYRNVFFTPKKQSVVVISPSDLPDIVTAGVLQGFYPRDVKVSFKKSSGKPSGLVCAPELPVHPRIPAHPRIPTITINRSDISSESERI